MGIEELSDMIRSPELVNAGEQMQSEPPSAGPQLNRGGRLRALGWPNMAMMLLFAAGLGCVYLLSLRSGPAKASAEQRKVELQVDSAMLQLTSSNLGKVGRRGGAAALVRTFYYQAQHRQIPLGALEGNPFVYTEPQAGLADGVRSTAEESSGLQRETQQRNLSQAMAAAKQLTLQSVLMNSRS
ncbi:unnamed protein product, partial [marine sediment metagenome]